MSLWTRLHHLLDPSRAEALERLEADPAPHDDWNRRAFLRALGLGAAGALLTPADLLAGTPAKKKGEAAPEANWIEPDGLTGAAITLPAWRYGTSSTATDTMLMFRGNPTHTFYGTGPIRDNPELKWTQELARFHTKLRGRPKTWTGTGWSGQPVKLGDYVYVGGQGGYAYAFEAATGTIRWRHKGMRMFKGSACAYKNRIYLGNTDDFYRCLNASTGALIWKINTGTDCDSSGVVVDDRLYVAGESGFLRCLNPDTGAHHWKTYLGGTGKGTLGGSNGSETSPAVADGEVYSATYDGFLHCIDARTGARKWKAETGDDTDVSPVIVGDRVYTAAEDRAPRLYCFDRAKKGKVVWSFANTGGWWSTPAVVGDRLYIGGQDGFLYCLNAKSGAEIWKHRVGAPVWSSPAVVEDRVIFGSYDPYLRMLDAKTGKLIWKQSMGGRVLSTPIVVNGAIYVGSSAGKFRCFA